MTKSRRSLVVAVMLAAGLTGCPRARPTDPPMVALGPQLGESTASPGADPDRAPPDAAGPSEISVPISPSIAAPAPAAPPVVIEGPQAPVIVAPPPVVVYPPAPAPAPEPPPPPPPVFAPPPAPEP